MFIKTYSSKDRHGRTREQSVVWLIGGEITTKIVVGGKGNIGKSKLVNGLCQYKIVYYYFFFSCYESARQNDICFFRWRCVFDKIPSFLLLLTPLINFRRSFLAMWKQQWKREGIQTTIGLWLTCSYLCLKKIHEHV